VDYFGEGVRGSLLNHLLIGISKIGFKAKAFPYAFLFTCVMLCVSSIFEFLLVIVGKNCMGVKRASPTWEKMLNKCGVGEE